MQLPTTFRHFAYAEAVRLSVTDDVPSDLFNPDRARARLLPDRVLVAVALRNRGLSWPEVAGAMGYRSHTSIMEQVNKRRVAGSLPTLADSAARQRRTQ
jgi:hypothetical protein